MITQFTWRHIRARFVACWKDDAGSAMTEYVIVNMATLPLVFYLFYPGNDIYTAARSQYDQATALIMMPGP